LGDNAHRCRNEADNADLVGGEGGILRRSPDGGAVDCATCVCKVANLRNPGGVRGDQISKFSRFSALFVRQQRPAAGPTSKPTSVNFVLV
jgi:hypothetical protein